MSPSRDLLFLGLVAGSLLLPLYASARPAEGREPTVTRPPDRSRQLEGIRREIDDLENRLEVAEAQRSDLGTQLEAATLEVELQEARLAEAVAAHQQAEMEFQLLERDIEQLESSANELLERLGKRLAAVYRFGAHGYLRLVLQVERRDAVLPTVRQLRYLVRHDAEILDEFRATERQLATARDAALDRQREIESWVDREAEQQAVVDQTRAQFASRFSAAERHQRALEQRARDLEQRERGMAELMAALSEGRAAELAGRPITDFRGALDWPLWGRVTVPFGPRRDPVYGTMVPNNGIEIASAEGVPVTAVFGGQVLFAAPFQDYGFTVVMQHAGGGITLYAGLQELRTERGVVLDLGDIVGVSTARLYFEIRSENRPQDPALWLR